MFSSLALSLLMSPASVVSNPALPASLSIDEEFVLQKLVYGPALLGVPDQTLVDEVAELS